MIFSGIAAAIGAVVGAVGSAVAAAGTIIGGLGALGTAALQAAVGLGISYLAKAIAGSPDAPASQQASFSVQGTLQSGGDIPRSFVLGYGATAGSLTYANAWGNSGETPNAYFTQVIALSDLPVTGLREVWVNGELCTLADTPHAEFGYPVLEYRTGSTDHLWVKFYNGRQTAVDNFLITKVGSSDRPYPATRVGYGVAYVICTSLVNDTLFTGFPTFKFALQGVALYDPSKDSTAGGDGDQRYSDPSTWGGDGDDLPAVQIYNLCRGFDYNGTWFYGLQNLPAARVPSANWIAQIGKCRAEIQGEDGLEPTYRAGGQINVNAQLSDAIEALLTSCQGKLSEIGGTYKVHLGAPDSATFQWTDADIISTEEQSFTPFFGLADTVNGIAAKYPSPPEGWNTKSAPSLLNPDFEAQDGNRRLMADVALDFVPYTAQVQRLMKSALDEARRARRHTHTLPPPFWVVEPGDVGEWTSERNGYDAKLFRVDGVLDKANLDVVVDLTEVDPSDYDWDHDADFTPVVEGPTIFPRPPAQPIVDWFAEGAIIKDTDGINRRPAILLSWDGEMADVVGVAFEVRLKSTGVVVYRGRTDNPQEGSILISQQLLPDMEYETRGRYIPGSPRLADWSDWITVTTPDVKFSAIDFEDGLKDLVTNYFGQTTDQINSVLQTISAVVAQQAGTNQNDKKQVIERLVATAGRLGASISEVKTVAVNAETALAEFQVAATAMIDEHSASIEQTQTAVATINGKLATAWALTTNVEGYISSVQSLNDGTTSAFIIMADIFKILFPGQTPKDVFQIANVNGVPQAVFRGDMFADGLLTARMISVSELTAISAHFGDAVVTGKLTGGPSARLEVNFTTGTIIGYRP